MLRKLTIITAAIFSLTSLSHAAFAFNPSSVLPSVSTTHQNQILLAKADEDTPKTSRKKKASSEKAAKKTKEKTLKKETEKSKSTAAKKEKKSTSSTKKDKEKAVKTDKKTEQTPAKAKSSKKNTATKKTTSHNSLTRHEAKNFKPAIGNKSCSCASATYCVGPREGHYCYTSGGNKRYISRK